MESETREARNMLRSRPARLAVCLLPLAVCLCLLAAAPPQSETPEELIRRANELFPTDAEAAGKLYAAAEERTADPGLVAFNRGAVLFDRAAKAVPAERYSLYFKAEEQYDLALKDAACPPERAAKAWFNRGTCLLSRGGALSVYRSAIACFEHALDSPAADDDLKKRAEHNLELAKLLWNEERKKAAKPDEESPNKKLPPEEEPQQQPRPEPEKPGGTEQNPADTGNAGATQPKIGTQPQAVPQPNTGDKPTPADQKTVGNNANLQVPQDQDQVQKLSPEEARAYMKETSKRRKRELHSMLETLYGPDRPGVRD
jgi:hypothetical protein